MFYRFSFLYKYWYLLHFVPSVSNLFKITWFDQTKKKKEKKIATSLKLSPKQRLMEYEEYWKIEHLRKGW